MDFWNRSHSSSILSLYSTFRTWSSKTLSHVTVYTQHTSREKSPYTLHSSYMAIAHFQQLVHPHVFPATGSPTCRVTVHDQQMVQWRLITNGARTTHLLHRDTPWTTGLLKTTQHTCNDWQPVNKCLLMSTCVMSVPFTVNDYHCWSVKTSVTFLHVCVCVCWGGGAEVCTLKTFFI